MPDELKLHLDALSRWIGSHEVLPKVEPGLTTDERKQLHAVNQSIQQLERLGVAIPDDLRHLKLNLTSRDQAGQEVSPLERLLEESEALVSDLKKIEKEARNLRDRVKNQLPKSTTKTHFGVELVELLEARLITSEDRFELQWLKQGPVVEGRIQSNGTVMAKTEDGWRQFDSLSAAGTSIADRPLNGWEHWYRLEPNGGRTKLKEIRDRFLKRGR